MWISDPWQMSEWAFKTIWCDRKQDNEEMRALITKPEWVYAYCKFIKSRKEMEELVSKDEWFEIQSERDQYMEMLKSGEGNGIDSWTVVGIPDPSCTDFFSIDLMDEITKIMSEKIAKELDNEILSSMGVDPDLLPLPKILNVPEK